MNCIKLILISVICCFLYVNPVKAEPDGSSKFFLQSGIANLELGDLEKARETFARIINTYQESSAEEKLKKLSDRQSSKVTQVLQSAYLYRGLTAYRLKEYREALADLETAQKIYPWQVEPYYNMGLAWSGRGEYERAIAEYNKALIQVSPQETTKIANIYNDRGLAYLNLHNFPAAINDFNLGIRHQGKDPWLHYNRGCACHRRGDYQEAINSFSQALAVNPQQSEAYINRGLIHYHLGHVKLALADINAGAHSFYNRGQMQQFNSAIELVKQMQDKIKIIPNLAA